MSDSGCPMTDVGELSHPEKYSTIILNITGAMHRFFCAHI